MTFLPLSKNKNSLFTGSPRTPHPAFPKRGQFDPDTKEQQNEKEEKEFSCLERLQRRSALNNQQICHVTMNINL